MYQFIVINPTEFQVPLNSRGRYDEQGEMTRVDKFGLGQMAGLEMALDSIKAAGIFKDFQYKDRVKFTCVDIQKAESRDFSDMPMFEIEIERD